MSKWKGAFELVNDAAAHIDKSVKAKGLDQWVRDDFDAIQGWYTEPAAHTTGPQNNPAIKDTRTLTLWTTRAGTTVEQERDMHFVETGHNTGVFRSSPFILVADDVDDRWDAAGQNNYDNYDNATDDPTIQVALGDEVHLKRNNFTASKPVPAFAEINVRVYSLDANPAPAFVGPGIAPVPIVSDAGVQKQIDYLKSMYAQVGIKVNVNKTNEYAPPTGLPNGQPQNFNASVPYKEEPNPATESEEKLLQEKLVTNLRTADVPKQAKYIHVYFVKEIAGGVAGFAYAPGRTNRVDDARFKNTVVMGKLTVDPDPNNIFQVDVNTLAHEVGHILRLEHVTHKRPDNATLTVAEVL